MIHPSVRTVLKNRQRTILQRLDSYFLFRAEITGGVMRAVGFRRQRVAFDVALRYRFA